MSQINPATDKCLWTARILKNDCNSYICISCFINETLRNRTEPQVTVTNFVINHSFVRGQYTPYQCDQCSTVITRESPINECSICTEKCTELLGKISSQGIRASHAHFLYDVYKDEIVYFHITSQPTSQTV